MLAITQHLQYQTIISFILAIGAAQGFLLSVFLFNKKENKIANNLLAITMIIFSIDLLAALSLSTGFIAKVPWISGLNNSFPYVYGPSIFLYVYIINRGRRTFKSKYMLNYLPFLLIQIYGVLFFYFESPEYQLSLFDTSIKQPWHISLIGGLIPVHGFIYLLLTLIETYRFNKKIKESYSNIEKINLNWVIYLVIGSTLIWVVVFISYSINAIYGDDPRGQPMIYIALSIMLYVFGFKSLRQPEIRTDRLELQSTEGSDSRESSYKKSGLSEENAEQYLEQLISLMENKKLYLENDITLGELAGRLNISTHNLSEIINKKLNKNFYDFINKYRVEEVKKLIREDKDRIYNILALGMEAGFSSKSAFYSSFKKYTGHTPAEYRSQLS